MEKLKRKIGIWVLVALTLSPLVITSAFGAIIGYFVKDGVPVSRIQLIATIPNFGILLFSLIVGRLSMSFPVKRLGQIGLLLIATGGLLPILLHSSVTQLLVCAFIMGIGLGFTGNVAPTLTSRYFEGEERLSVMGANTAFNSLGRMFMVMVGGYLGATHWYNTYWVFVIVLIAFIIFTICIPYEKPETSQHTEKDAKERTSMVQSLRELSGYVFLVAICSFMVSFFYSVYPTNLSIIVGTKNLGSTQVASLIQGLGTIGGLVAGFTMKYSKRALKNMILPIGYLITGAAFLCILYSNNSIVLIVASMFTNIGTSFIFATLPFMVSILSNPKRIALGMAVMGTLNSLGKTICPIVLGWFHIAAGEQQFLVGGIGFLAIGGVILVTNFGKLVQENKFNRELATH